MENYLFNIWSSNRKIRKLFMSRPEIAMVIEKASFYGINGSKLVLEQNGADVCENEVLQYIIKNNPETIFLLLNEQEQWISDNRVVTLETENINQSQHILCDIVDEADSGIPILISTEDEFEPTYSDDTLSMSSTAMSSTSSTNSTCKKFFSNFEIPWHKMPYDISQLLKNKMILGKRINVLANTIVDELRGSSLYIPMGVFRSVAQKAVEKYPDSIIEKDGDGNFLSTEPLALITKMRNRNNTLNRHPNQNPYSPIHIKHRKRTNVLKSTCTNWQPQHNENVSTIEYKKKRLQDFYQKQSISANDRKTVDTYMKECFATQRGYLNNTENIPSIANVLNEWPYLFDQVILTNHFQQLTNIDINIFETNFNATRTNIVQFLCSCTYLKIQNSSMSNKDILKGLCKYFKEDINLLLAEFDHGTSLEAIENQIPTNTPWAAIIKSFDPSENNSIVYIFVEKQQVMRESMTLTQILQNIICLYYIMNMMYPSQISQIMEFLVRFLLKHYPESVRGAKKTISNITKINNLITRLNNNTQ